MSNIITIKTFEALDKMRVAGRVAADALSFIFPYVQPGITTAELDAKLEAFIRKEGCTPPFLNYRGFPASSCISINEEVVHCIPSSRVLQEGDVVKIDFGTTYQGYNSDTAKTFIVGNASEDVRKFVSTGYWGVMESIKACHHGTPVSAIGNIIFSYITSQGYGIVDQFVGHGIGRNLHEAPQVSNTSNTAATPILVNGMVICIEPSYTIKPKAQIEIINGWNARTVGGILAGHWEHTVAITENGPEILTLTKEEKEYFNANNSR